VVPFVGQVIPSEAMTITRTSGVVIHAPVGRFRLSDPLLRTSDGDRVQLKRPWSRLVLVMRDSSSIQLEHDKLRLDMAAITHYGNSHPEAWVGLRFENEPTVRIVVLLAGDDVRAHELNLRRLVNYPDQLEVRSSRWPLSYLEEIRADLHQIGRTSKPGTLQGDGIRNGRLYVKLGASHEELAAELRDRYGDAIDLTVGSLHFPDMAVLQPDGSSKQSTKPKRPPLLPLDEFQVSIPQGLSVRSGETVTSALRVHYRGSDEVAIATGSGLIAHFVDPETQEEVGGYSGAVPAVARFVPIVPGGTADISLLIAAESAVVRLGYAIPPGRWEIVTTLSMGHRGSFRTPPLSINVVP
jgi:hypothetical protein